VAPPKKTTLLYHIPLRYVNLFDNFSFHSYTDIENSKREVFFMPYDNNSSLPFDYSALMERLHRLADTYSFLTLSYMGTSVLDRAIPILHVGSGGRRVLYVGAHHGMEWITSLVLVRFLEELCETVENRRFVKGIYPCDLLGGYTLSVVPMLNPDGVEYQIHGVSEENPLRERLLEMNGGSEDFSCWQANARGVDLNHNYDAGFAEYKKLEKENGIGRGAPTRYSGECAESEPEVAALCNLLRFLSPWRGVMTLHTQGEEIFSPSLKESEKSIVTARRLAKLTGYKLSRAEGLAAYGGMSDWCADALSIPSFTMECGRGQNPLPTTQFSSIYATMRAALFLFPTIL
jgi:g-D-glutamyl-meso-diaminopimelate peptidase